MDIAMKKKLILVGALLGGTALSGIAMAQVVTSAWPRVGLADLEDCRPVISQAHKLEQAFVRDVMIEDACDRRTRMYSSKNCKAAEKWLTETRVKDDTVWYFEGNDRCQGSDYPCFGVQIYNKVRKGAEADRWAEYILEKAGKPYGITRGMDLWTAARQADTCVAGIWAAKYQAQNGRRTLEGPPPVEIAEAERTAPAAAAAAGAGAAAAAGRAADEPPPPVEAKNPLTFADYASDATALAGASSESAATGAVAGATVALAAADAASDVAEASAPKAAPAETAAPVETASAEAPAADAPTVLKPESGDGAADPMKPVLALIAAGKMSEAIALGDKLAASQPAGDGQLTACKTRVLAKQDLDKALVACYSTGKSGDPEVLETRGQVHLLAGRPQDAWNDFNAAWTGGQANSALFLRGLASAELGRTSDAVKDMAKAEDAEQGIINAWEGKGYALAVAISGKPIAGPNASGAKDSAPKATTSGPGMKVVAAPLAKATGASKAVVTPIAGPTLSAPSAPLTSASTGSAPTEPAPEAADAPETPAAAPAAEASDAALNAADGATAAAAPVSIAAAVAATGGKAVSAVSPGSPVSVPGLSKPPATDCIEPLQQGAPDNPLKSNAFRNKCDYPVRFTYCISQPSIGTDAEAYTCGKTARYRTDILAPKGVQQAEVGREISYFACRGPSLPEVAYTKDNGLEGYCR